MLRPLLAAALCFLASPAAAETARVVALGDSLTAGYGLQQGEDFVSQLQKSLTAEGLDVKLENAGVSGDTSAGGKSRLEWAIGGEPKPRLVIVALGGNDLLRGIEPKVTYDNLDFILKTLKDKEIPALLVGMKSPTNLGPFYQKKFDRIYPDLADEYDVPLYPFFLDGVAMIPSMNQDDGIHPNIEGVRLIVKNITPEIKDALKD